MTLPIKTFHYSSEPEELDVSKIYDQILFYKPNGLWFSVEDEEDDQTWKTWCEAEEFCPENLVCCHEITFKTSAKILYLKSFDEILDFTKKYNATHLFPFSKVMDESSFTIDWEVISQEYDGIIIAPYCWNARLDHNTSWYYTWDCASGCIWNLNQIESMKLITQELVCL